MACQLPVDCLNEIFEYLEIDRSTLHSCLLVNRLWCEISVRILWRNALNFDLVYFKRSSNIYSILRALIACLPDESKILFIMIDGFFKNSKNSKSLVANEIIKMFANQISSLKKLTYYHDTCDLNISFPHFPGARDLSELYCSSELPPDFFYQLSQICHNLQSISVNIHTSSVINELKDLISSQNNLKDLDLSAFHGGSWTDIAPAITKHSHTITKLKLWSDDHISSFSFISSFSNLQELTFSLYIGVTGVFEDFIKLQYVNFSKLQILKFPYEWLKPEYVMKFLENNGKNLKKFYANESNKDLRLSIAKFCPNLKSLFITFMDDEQDVLKTIFISCQYLESIKILCGKSYLSVKEVFETVAINSPSNFRELKIRHITNSDASTDDLESFFACWERRTPKKLLSFTIIEDMGYHLYYFHNSLIKVIEKYENLGTIKFATIDKIKEVEE
ncbi:hypothetical protein RhiirA4_469491 [Rhizophagus irregularis]|uniref:F-box domain-containing protein n=1 Tax=Rhizophagus irregularis TaxID=588596 RepID=A0A2I1GZM6_9GLOM|nr:hypothetical protein RhiirA4_469491 [Rhizophagus irregularis]